MSPRCRIFSPAACCARRRAGFTLLEILLSLALVALMLVALNTFVFSMGELWGKNTDIRLFEQHVRAVTRALNFSSPSGVSFTSFWPLFEASSKSASTVSPTQSGNWAISSP